MGCMAAEYPLEFSIDGQEGAGKAVVEEDSLTITPTLGEARYISLRDILEVKAGDYKVVLTLTGGILSLSSLGLGYENFLRELNSRRNELIIKDMLMTESLVMGNVRADFVSVSQGKSASGQCEARVYKTALVLMPDFGEPLRLPFCDMDDVRQDGFSIKASTIYGDKIELTAMGKSLDPFRNALSGAMSALMLQTQALLKDAVITLDTQVLSKAARLMRDGKAARRKDLDAISPTIWPGLRKRMEAAGLKDEFALLDSMSIQEQMCIGVKKGLMDAEEEEYIWLIAPLKGRNVIALEATSSEETGRATYLFRIIPGKGQMDVAEQDISSAIVTINRCMIAMNFRREPIYLDDDSLADPKYSAYRFSIARMPELRSLRSLFISRVMHTEGWADRIKQALP